MWTRWTSPAGPMNLVDNPNQRSARVRPTTPDYAATVDSTRGGTLGDAARPAPSRAVVEGRATSSALSERLLLRGYGLDPDDLEAELLDRVRRR
jgi:hypothetical protein